MAETAARAAKTQNLPNAILGRVDEATFQDLLANEIWWADFRGYGCAVIVGGKVRVTWHLPGGSAGAVALADAARAGAANATGTAKLVTGPAGPLMAAVASIDGVDGGRLLLARPVDRALVTELGTRSNTILVLSDGQKLLGASVPENTLPELGLLIGKESMRVLLDKKHGRLAAAMPWSSALWLWGVTGWGS